MTSGIHHITLIARKVQANVDFYVGFLGLKLVKRTAGFEDAAQLHLFYGDAIGSPGSLVSFLVWEDGAQGRVGHGQPSEIAFAIPSESIGFWLTRALRFGIATSGPAQEFGEPVIRLKDPDGVIVKLVGTDVFSSKHVFDNGEVPKSDAIRRLRGATILTEKPSETTEVITRHFGYRELAATDAIQRLVSDSGDIIDVRNAGGFWTAAPGTGTIDHIAFRAVDKAEVKALKDTLAAEGDDQTAVHDRKYFFSLYMREPGGTLFEFATDAPGMAVDEETLGSHLFIPAHFTGDREAMTVMLPQFALPGEERFAARELPFVHRLNQPDEPDGSTLILLHGSGASETSLLPLGRKAAPHSLLFSLRGRSTEEGAPRFFRRLTPFTFDQADIASETEAFAATMEDADVGYGLDAARMTFLGYSNGANMITATMLLQPGFIRRAILLRAMNPLTKLPDVDLSGIEVLIVTGATDPYAPHAPALENLLLERGATVEAITISAGHEIGDADAKIAAEWLSSRNG
ncbi:VOC family protein [Pararhizobium capsulatum]|nr:VOC family protein [Pararhizobium capsulatum]